MRAGVLVGLLLAACGGGGDGGGSGGDGLPVPDAAVGLADGPAGATARVTARVLNGATPAAAIAISARGGVPAPADGNWKLSPDQLRLTLIEVQLTESATGVGGGARAELTGCVIETDLAQPGLAQLVTCPFTVAPGTYAGFGLIFDGTYEALIDDDQHGFYSTPGGLVTTPPVGGAGFMSVASGDRFGASGALPEPITIEDGADVTLSIVVNGLQFFKATVAAGGATLGWFGDGDPFRPGMVASFGGVAKLGYYVRQEIGTALGRNTTGASPVMGITSAAVYYAGPTTPTFVGIDLNDTPPGCEPIGASFVASTSGSYLGLDAVGTLGWALATDPTFATYSVELSMPERSTLGETTELRCRGISADPAPAGGSYASGAPDITSPDAAYTMVLVAR